MTPSSILSRVRDQLVEATASFWTDAELYRYMSDAESEINNMVECYQLTGTAAAATGTSAYTLPTDCVTVTRLTYDGVPLKLVSQRERSNLDQPGYGSTVQTGDSTHWYMYGGMAYLWPVPSRAPTIKYWYVAEPVDISTASSSFSVPQQFQNAIQDYVLYRAFTKDQDQGKAEWHKREFMQAMMDLKSREQRRRWAGGFPKVIDSDKAYSTYDGIV
jgi:hypothetical protein